MPLPEDENIMEGPFGMGVQHQLIVMALSFGDPSSVEDLGGASTYCTSVQGRSGSRFQIPDGGLPSRLPLAPPRLQRLTFLRARAIFSLSISRPLCLCDSNLPAISASRLAKSACSPQILPILVDEAFPINGLLLFLLSTFSSACNLKCHHHHCQHHPTCLWWPFFSLAALPLFFVSVN